MGTDAEILNRISLGAAVHDLPVLQRLHHFTRSRRLACSPTRRNASLDCVNAASSNSDNHANGLFDQLNGMHRVGSKPLKNMAFQFGSCLSAASFGLT